MFYFFFLWRYTQSPYHARTGVYPGGPMLAALLWWSSNHISSLVFPVEVLEAWICHYSSPCSSCHREHEVAVHMDGASSQLQFTQPQAYTWFRAIYFSWLLVLCCAQGRLWRLSPRNVLGTLWTYEPGELRTKGLYYQLLMCHQKMTSDYWFSLSLLGKFHIDMIVWPSNQIIWI